MKERPDYVRKELTKLRRILDKVRNMQVRNMSQTDEVCSMNVIVLPNSYSIVLDYTYMIYEMHIGNYKHGVVIMWEEVT